MSVRQRTRCQRRQVRHQSTGCATAFTADVSRLREEPRSSSTFVQLQGVALSHQAVVYQRGPRDPCSLHIGRRRAVVLLSIPQFHLRQCVARS